MREADRVTLRGFGLGEGIPSQYPSLIRDAAVGRQGLLTTNGHAPEAPVHGIGRAIRRNRQATFLQEGQLFWPFESSIPHRRDDLKAGR